MRCCSWGEGADDGRYANAVRRAASGPRGLMGMGAGLSEPGCATDAFPRIRGDLSMEA